MTSNACTTITPVTTNTSTLTVGQSYIFQCPEETIQHIFICITDPKDFAAFTGTCKQLCTPWAFATLFAQHSALFITPDNFSDKVVGMCNIFPSVQFPQIFSNLCVSIKIAHPEVFSEETRLTCKDEDILGSAQKAWNMSNDYLIDLIAAHGGEAKIDATNKYIEATQKYMLLRNRLFSLLQINDPNYAPKTECDKGYRDFYIALRAFDPQKVTISIYRVMLSINIAALNHK